MVLPNPIIQLLKIKAKPIRLSNTICPAEMATNNRIINEMGLVNTPINSTGKMIIRNIKGTPGVQNTWVQ